MRTYVKLFFAGLVIVAGAVVCLITIGRFGERIAVTTEKPSQAAEGEKEAMTGEKPDQTTEGERLIREKLLQAVENAKRGDRRELDMMIEFVPRDKGVNITKKMLSEFISFLNEKDTQVQLLGTHGLYILKSPESKQVLSEYLKGKDFAKLEEMVSTGIIDRRYARWEVQASSLAIMTLGKLGDKSVIPLLESIRQKANLEFEWGFSPVEEALAELGAVEILSNIPPDADERQIRRASRAIRKIRDPNKAPELMTIVYDVNCARSISSAALRALGKINTVGVPEFLLRLMNDSRISVSMRRTAVITAAQTGNEIFEETLLAIADSNSEIRIEGLCGLTLLKPDKYLKNIFKMMRDINEPDEFRNTLAARFIMYIPSQQKRQMLEGQKDELYACLNTNKTDDSPEMRVRIWCQINKLFGEEPTLVLSSKSHEVTSHLRHPIETKIIMSNPHLSHEETEKKIDEKINTIVQVYKPQSEGEKENE
ncbi:MAG: HEAT repeat domain-containing protein [Planctomycetota bacterium]|jgi:HEAT repeat protein